MTEQKNVDLAKKLIQGAYDLHTHSSPSHVARSLDDDELMVEAAQMGMQGVMLKSHYEPTAGRAMLANKRHQGLGVTAFGAVALNQSVGGLNPYAVHSALKLGAVMVYMPTLDSLHAMRVIDFAVYPREGITLLDENGSLKKPIYDIIEIVKEHNACLATGHTSMEEARAVCKACIDMGARVMLQHPDWQGLQYPLAFQKEMVAMGAYIEKCWLNVVENVVTGEFFVNSIKEIGTDRMILVTDHGQKKHQHPAPAMLECINFLLEQGIIENDITNMVCIRPREVVGS